LHYNFIARSVDADDIMKRRPSWQHGKCSGCCFHRPCTINSYWNY